MFCLTVRTFVLVASITAVLDSPLVLAQREPDRGPTLVHHVEAGASLWTHLAAHPTDPNRLMACGITVRPRGADPATVAFVDLSEEGGKSWRRVLTDAGSRLQSEESCAFGLDGRAYFTVTREHDRQGLWLYRSDDDGRTWRMTRERGPFVDLTQMVVDTDRASPYAGRLYILGHAARDVEKEPRPFRKGRLPMPLLRSEDRGETLLGPVTPPRELDHWRQISFPGGLVTLADGTVLGVVQSMHTSPVVEDTPPQRRDKWVEVVRSVDGGRMLSIVPVAKYEYWLPQGSVPDLPSIAAGPRRSDGRQDVYLVWNDLTSGRTTIKLAVSTDRGATWSTPIVVPAPASAGREETFAHVHANVAVNRDGVVAVSWRDVAGACWRLVASRSGGVSFSAPVSLNECRVPANASPREGAYSIDWGSEVGFVSSTDGRFHLAWAELNDVKNRDNGSRFVHASVDVSQSTGR